jgi:hypothetical protein
MQNKEKSITQYFSKHALKWCFFEDSFGNKYLPNDAEITELKKYYYKLR